PSNGMIIVIILGVTISGGTRMHCHNIADRDGPLFELLQQIQRRPWRLECLKLVCFGVEPHVSCGMLATVQVVFPTHTQQLLHLVFVKELSRPLTRHIKASYPTNRDHTPFKESSCSPARLGGELILRKNIVSLNHQSIKVHHTRQIVTKLRSFRPAAQHGTLHTNVLVVNDREAVVQLPGIIQISGEPYTLIVSFHHSEDKLRLIYRLQNLREICQELTCLIHVMIVDDVTHTVKVIALQPA